ncbi:MAG: cohesin domain-containing protein, partial [Holophagaceae bacterium]
VTPVQVPSVTDVIVTNPNNASSTLNAAFTYVSTSASLSIPNQTSAQNTIVILPINAAVVNGLVAADFTVTFNPAVLKPRTVTTGSLTPGWTVTSNNQISGQIRVSMISGGGAVSGSGVLAQLEFEVLGSPGSSSSLAFSTVSLNAGSIPVSSAAGSLTVAVAYDISGSVRHWKSNAPVSDVYLETVGDKIYSSTTNNSG